MAAATMSPTVACNQDPAVRSLLIRILLNTVSNSNVVGTEGTSQSQAANWLINQDTRFLCPDSPTLLSRYALAVFYYSTRGDRWLECSAPTSFNDTATIEAANTACTIQSFPDSGSDAWLTPGDECQWGGVVCNDDGNVEILNIGTLLMAWNQSLQKSHCYMYKSNMHHCVFPFVVSCSERNGLSGTLASELQAFTSLQFLQLQEGVISGSIPTEIGNIATLEVLDMNFNFLVGSLPDELYNLSNLRQMDLNDNRLTGSISTRIGQLAALDFLQLQNNQITGTIPTEMGNLFLDVVTIENNRLQGSMPSTVCALRSRTLSELTTDCSAESQAEGSPPYVACDLSCCTRCF